MRGLSLTTKLHLSLVPLGITALAVTALTWTSLSSNSQELVETHTVKELAVASLANLLVQDDATKAMLLGFDSPALAARKIAAYDADMRALARIGQLSHSNDIARMLKELEAIEEKDVVSFKDREEDRRRGLEAGADYYLTKSGFDDEALRTAVVHLIGESTR